MAPIQIFSKQLQRLFLNLQNKSDGWTEVVLVEDVPWNIGTGRQQFLGVGSYLFAYTYKRSLELGFEGHVAFPPRRT